MKEDIEIPPRPPRKRRHLEQSLDVWLAAWESSDELSPSERRRVREERERRKQVTARGRRVVGFTGTRAGMTPEQKAAVEELLAGAQEAHHGDCIGADAQFHSLCRKLKVAVILHPPSEKGLRAFSTGADRSEIAMPYVLRNREIVRASTVLVAAPKEASEPAPAQGQGTWSTVRWARGRRSIAVQVVMPDGHLQQQEEN